ncbi:MAG: hypothetical protein FWG74_01210 [Planctomycetes bacterium]|nr:hypothetical protein [Planctomycetota bacterium]
MAGEAKNEWFLLRPRFLLFCLYVMCYVALRGSGEILHQAVEVRGLAVLSREHVIGADRSLPRWRRQAYRTFLSPLMVAEEEGRRLLDRTYGLVQDVGAYSSGL